LFRISWHLRDHKQLHRIILNTFLQTVRLPTHFTIQVIIVEKGACEQKA